MGSQAASVKEWLSSHFEILPASSPIASPLPEEQENTHATRKRYC